MRSNGVSQEPKQALWSHTSLFVSPMKSIVGLMNYNVFWGLIRLFGSLRSFNGSQMLFTGVLEGPMKSEVIWGHFLDKPVAQRQEMVISTLALLSGLFMVAFEVSRALPTKEMCRGNVHMY